MSEARASGRSAPGRPGGRRHGGGRRGEGPGRERGILPCGCPAAWPSWAGGDVDLGGQPVHVQPLRTLLWMPMGYQAFRMRQQRELELLELEEPWPGLTLVRMGPFRGQLLRLLREADSPSRRVQHLPAPFRLRARLHRGGMATLRQAVQALQRELLEAGRMPKELYLAHLSCPRCQEAKGGELILLLRRWEDSPRLRRRRR